MNIKSKEIKKFKSYIEEFKYCNKELTEELKEKIIDEINSYFGTDIEEFEQLEDEGVYSNIEDENYMCPIAGFTFVIEENKIIDFDTDLDN